MKRASVLGFCLLLSLSLMSVVQSRYIGPRIYSRSVGDYQEDLAKRGWLTDKAQEIDEKFRKGMDNMDEKIKKGLEASGKAVEELWAKVKDGYNKLIG